MDAGRFPLSEDRLQGRDAEEEGRVPQRLEVQPTDCSSIWSWREQDRLGNAGGEDGGRWKRGYGDHENVDMVTT